MRAKRASRLILFGFLLLFVFSFSEAGAVNVIRNGDFNNGLTDWNINPKISSTWNPLISNAVNLHPPTSMFSGTVIYQNLNVTGIAGMALNLSLNLKKNYASEGKTIAVYFAYVNNANTVNRVRVLNPANTDFTDTNYKPLTSIYTFPSDARKLVRIEIDKEDYGDFTVDDITLSADGITASGIPAIINLSPASGDYNSPITITGSNLGSTQGNVAIGGSGSGVTITNWTDASITFTLQDPARSGKVIILSDFVESNLDKTFEVTSPNFTVDVMNPDVTVVKGQSAEFVIKVDLLNGYTTTSGIYSKVDISAIDNVSSFNPGAYGIKKSGGAVLRINTSTLPAGKYQLNVESCNFDNCIYSRSAPFTLEILTVADIKFFESVYDPNTQTSTKTYITQKNITKQGSFYVPYEGVDSNGKPLQLDTPFITLQSGDPSILGIYKSQWGYETYALNNGSTTITATAADGTTGQLTVNITVPDTPKVTLTGLNPQTITNKYTDPISFSAQGTEAIGYGYSGFITLIEDTRDWVTGTNNTAVSGTFKVDHAQTGIGTYLFNASTGYPSTTSLSVAPLTITNDPTYSAIKGGAKSIDGSLQDYAIENFTLEFYNPQAGTLAFSKNKPFSHMGGGAFDIGAIQPGTYKVKIVPSQGSSGGFEPQWYPNATDINSALPLAFNAGQAVENINFFLKAVSQQSQQLTLTVSKAGTGTGTVTSETAGISCGTDCSEVYDSGAAVTLTAAADTGATFTGWSGGGCSGTGTCSVTVNADTTVTATFTAQASEYSISGMVKNVETNAGISDAAVTVKDGNNNVVVTVTTNATGNYIANVSAAGDYTVDVSMTGYDTVTAPQLAALTDTSKTATVDFLMSAITGGGEMNSIALSKGWNFISVPKQHPTSSIIETALAGILSNLRIIWSYSSYSKEWLKWKPGVQNNTLTSIEPGIGYWIYANEATVIDLSQWTAPASATIHLYAGWNLIGYNGTDGADVITALGGLKDTSNNPTWIIIWTWGNGQWSAKHLSISNLPVPALNTMKQGKAYWLKLKPDGSGGGDVL